MPKYQHDCDSCIFLGNWGPCGYWDRPAPPQMDVYFCPNPDEPTILARRSDKGSDYSSFWTALVDPSNADAWMLYALYQLRTNHPSIKLVLRGTNG